MRALGMRALESTAGPCVCLLAYLVILLPLPSNGATETPESVRWLMVSHMYRGMSIAYIMQACLRSRSTVGRILRLFRKTGTVRPEGAPDVHACVVTHPLAARSGRPTQLTRSEIYELRKLVREDPTGYYDEYAIKMSVKYVTATVSTLRSALPCRRGHTIPWISCAISACASCLSCSPFLDLGLLSSSTTVEYTTGTSCKRWSIVSGQGSSSCRPIVPTSTLSSLYLAG